jgi:4-hydroxy-2-oxoglutarate aldolase
MKLGGIFAPITTPFTADGERLALDKLKPNFQVYNRTGLAGYVVCGSTGEANLLTWEETERLFAAVPEHTAKGKLLVAGTGVDSLAETILRSKRAAQLGYHAVLVRTPHYYKPFMTPAALLDYYRRVADASPAPVLVYSIPQFTGVDVSADLAAKLAQHPNILGIKESSGRLAVVSEIISAAPAGFQTLVGSASIIEPSLKLGATGAILGLACILPDLCAQIFDAAHKGDTKKAEALQVTLEPIGRKCVSETGPAGVKYSMDCVGMFGGTTRSPLLPLDEKQKQGIQAALATVQTAAAR